MKRNIFVLTSGAFAALLLGSCTSTNTPQYRIDKNPTAFSALPVYQQRLVEEGKLCQGMDSKAVFLAWGYPNNPPYEGNKNGQSMTRWVYSRLEPVMSSPLWRGPAWSPYGWYDPAYRFNTDFVPRNTASVVFEDGKVVSWESQYQK